MSKRIVKIKEEKRVYDGHLKIDEAIIKDTLENGSESEYMRQRVASSDAVAGLIYNTDTECIVMVKQYRYSTHTHNRSGFIYEAVAGKIDKDESPEDAFIRECLEEVGYKVKTKNIQYCFRCYTCPGYSTERIYYFLATVTNKDRKKNAGGGLKSEDEVIEICEIHYLQFKSMMDTMEDAKTKLLAYEAHHRKLFEKKEIKSSTKTKITEDTHHEQIKFEF